RQVAGLEQVRIEVLGTGHMAALPATLAVVVEHEEAGLTEPRGHLRDGELTNLHAYNLALTRAHRDRRRDGEALMATMTRAAGYSPARYTDGAHDQQATPRRTAHMRRGARAAAR